MKQPGAKRLSLLLLTLLGLSACVPTFERPTRVKLMGGSQPSFLLSGSGALGDLIVYGPKQRDVGGDRNFALWEIVPIKGFLEGRRIEELGTVKYGVLPTGYQQIYLEDGSPPPLLVSGVRYEYWFQTVGAPDARGYFEIRDGKAVDVTP